MNTKLWLTTWKNSLLRSRGRNSSRRHKAVQRQTVEVLERKSLLTGVDCFGQIDGVTYHDLAGDGVIDASDPRLSFAADGVQVHLFDAGLNGVYDSAGTGGVAAGDDVFVATVQPDVNGEYSFADLPAGTYFVEQPTPAGFIQRAGETVSAPIVITALDASGTAGGILIDDFTQPGAPDPAQIVVASPSGTNPEADATGGLSVLGTERDLYAQVTSANGGLTLSANNFGSELLEFSASATATGTGVVTWDGADGDANAVDVDGLNAAGLDLTNGGTTTGFRFDYGGDKAGQTMTLTVYETDGTSVSEAFVIPDTTGNPLAEVYSPFTDFAGFDFTDVGAIEMRIDSTVVAFQLQLSYLRTVGPTITNANFGNALPMTLGGTVFGDTNNSGTFQPPTETGIDTVAVTLFEDLDGNGTFAPLTTGTTSGGGDYAFTNLYPGDYYVQVDAANFGGGGILENLSSSTGNGVAPDPDINQDDNDDNGDHIGGVTTAAIVTQPVTLVNNGEPIDDGDADNNTNFSLDFGVFGTVDVEVVKTDNANLITAGSGTGNLIYTITAFNNGPLDATGVSVTDALLTNLPTGWTIESVTPSAGTSYDANSGVWTIGDLANRVDASDDETLTVTITVGPSAVATTTTNTATVSAVNEIDSNLTNNTDDEDTTVVREVDVEVVKTDNANVITAGSGTGNLIYTVTAFNNGPSAASGVTVTDALLTNLPVGWTIDSVVPSTGTSYDANSGVWTIGDLDDRVDANNDAILTVTITVGPSALATTTTNTATVSAVNETDSDPNNNTDDEDTTVIRDVDVEVVKTDNANLITAGSGAGNLVYTVTAFNNGPSDASGVAITDALLTNLPVGWTIDSVTPSAGTSYDQNSGVWTIGNLSNRIDANDDETLTVSITVGASALATTTTNTATVSAVNETDSDPNNNSDDEDTTVIREVDIEVVKTDNQDPITAGSGPGNLVYTITAFNNGPSDASGVAVTDALLTNLPVGWTIDSVAPSAGTTYDQNSGVWTIGNLADRVDANDDATLIVTITVGTTATNGTTTNTATVSAVNETDSNPNNNSFSEDTSVGRVVDVEVVKTDNANVITAGSGPGNLIYTVTAFNNGPSDATGVTVTDALLTNLPIGWTIDSVAPSAGTTYDANSGVWTIGDLDDRVDANDDAILTVTITVGSSALATTTTNTATVSAVNETDSDPNNNTDDEDTTVIRDVDVEVVKTDNANLIAAGSGAGNLVYTVTAFNNGPSDATGVTVTDALLTNLPVGWTIDSVTPSAGTTYDQNSGVWTIGGLSNRVDANDDETLTVTITVGASALATTTTNTATVSAVNETDSDPNNNTDDEDTTVIREVDIEVTKSDNEDPITAGSGPGNLVYTITAFNNGPSDATGVAVTDALLTNLPVGWTLVSAVGSAGTNYDSNSGVWTIGDLANRVDANDDATLTVTITVDTTAAGGTTTNTATVSAVNETDSNPNNNSFSEDTTVGRFVDVQVVKSDNADLITAGSGPGNLVYTVTASNNGPSDATGVAVTDALLTNLPVGWTIDTVTPSAGTTYDANSGIWTIGDLANRVDANDDRTLTVTITVGPSALATTTTNTATVSAVNETDSDPNNNTDDEDTTVIRDVDVEVVKTDNANLITAGSGPGNLVYTVTAFNNGPSHASGVTVTDALLTNLPVGWTIDSVTPSAGTTYDQNSGVWTIGGLNNRVDANDDETLTVTITVGASALATTTTNTASVSAVNETDSDPNNNTDDEDTTVIREVDIQVIKSDNEDPITAGDGTGNLVYTITARNNGPSDASGVALTDALLTNLPTGWTLASAVPSTGTTYDQNTGIWTIGNLANRVDANDDAILTVTITVGATAVEATTINTATVTAVNETDTDPNNNSFSENTTVSRLVDVEVLKSDSNDPVTAGSGDANLTYTITAQNNGPSQATGVEVTDAFLANLPTGITINSVQAPAGTSFDNATGVWTIGSLSNDQPRDLTVSLTVGSAAAAGTITNVANITAVNETDGVPANNSATEPTTIVRDVDLVINKTDSVDPVRSPGQIEYVIRVDNNGPSDASNVTVTDTLSSLVDYVSGVSSQGATVENGGVVTSTLGSIAAGQFATVTIVVNVDLPMGGVVNNVAAVTSTEPDRTPGNNTEDENTTVSPGLASISGVVYQDLNDNGVQDEGEPPIAGTLINLFGEDNNGNTVVRTTRTDANGAYLIGDLLAGQYSLFEVQPGVYLDGADTSGTGATATLLDDAFVDLNLAAGANAVAFNFGEGRLDESKRNFLASNQPIDQLLFRQQPVTGTASLSGTVALDNNTNGVFDAGDTGLAGATVSLAGTDSAGNTVLITRTTDGSGNYAFRDLAAGTYSIIESQPPGFFDGTEQSGSLMSDSVVDDVFAAIALPDGGTGTGFNFLELTEQNVVTGNQQPVLAALSVQTTSRPVLSWAPVDDAASYEVWLDQVTDDVGLVYHETAATGTSLQVPVDLNLGVHRMWVRSIDASGQKGEWSDPVTFTASPTPVLLSPIVSSIDTRPTFTWTSVGGADSYDLAIYDTAGNLIMEASDLTSTSYASRQTFSEGNYRAWVRAKNSELTGEWSEGGEFGVTGAPLALKPVAASVLAAPLLEWSDTGAHEYEVWINDVTGSPQVVAVETVQGTSFLLPETLPEGTYRYWVRAADADGNATRWSTPQTFEVASTTTLLTPGATADSDRPTFSWTPVAGATHYDVWVSDSSGLFLREQNVTGTSHSFATSFATGNYRVWVQPVGVNGRGSWSTATKFTVGSLDAPTLTTPSGTTTDRTPTFAWSAVAGASRYELWVNHVGVTNRVIHEESLTSTSFTPTSNLAEGTHRFWVRAISANGVPGKWSSAVQVSIA